MMTVEVMEKRVAEKISDTEMAAYERDGFVRLGVVLDERELDELRQRINAIMMGEFHYPGMHMQVCPSSGFESGSRPKSLAYRKIQDLEMDPVFRRYIQAPLFRDITQKLIGERVSSFRSMFFNKPAGGGVPLEWHNDGRNWGLSIKEQFSIYTALDASTRANGCLQVVPGSHRTEHPDTLDTDALIEAYAPESKRAYLEMAQGEVILFNINLLHHSLANQTERPRRAFSVAYIDAASEHVTSGQRYPQVMPTYIPAEQMS